MKKKDIKNTIQLGFNKLYKLDNLSWDHYREQMFKDELASERQHRSGKPYGIEEKPKATATLAAKYFVVKWVLEALQDCTIKPSDVLHCRKASLMAKGIVDLYRETVEECLKGFDVEAFNQIDYSEHLCG